MWETLHHRKSANKMPHTDETGMKMSENRPGRYAPWDCHNIVAVIVNV